MDRRQALVAGVAVLITPGKALGTVFSSRHLPRPKLPEGEVRYYTKGGVRLPSRHSEGFYEMEIIFPGREYIATYREWYNGEWMKFTFKDFPTYPRIDRAECSNGYVADYERKENGDYIRTIVLRKGRRTEMFDGLLGIYIDK